MRAPAYAACPLMGVGGPSRGRRSAAAAFALDAVLRGTAICERAAREVQAGYGVRRKLDKSPVTSADYAIQAVVGQALHSALGGVLVAEEDVADFDALPLPLRQRVAALAQLPMDAVRVALARRERPSECRSVWLLDPIDGTAGLLSGGSYAIGLARAPGDRRAAPDVAALALPSRSTVLLVDDGVLSVHRCDGRGTGSTDAARGRCRWHFSPASHTVAIAGLPPATELCCGSLVKYGEVALCASTALIQALPSCRARAWDHLAGVAAVVASGGAVTDLDGGALVLGSSGGDGPGCVDALFVDAPGIVATARGVDHARYCALARLALAGA
jgi:3'-phosphoadenosine 5'-phosphosulfate (PAPS) 3'-phosphatase